jgi:hypothetical protein
VSDLNGNGEDDEGPDLQPIVPASFAVPDELVTANTMLRRLGPEHNVSDYAAWTSSMDHVRATPGFGPDRSWPDESLTIEGNLADLEMHSRHFDERVGFTYTVLDRAKEAEVLGCVYIYADPDGVEDAGVRSWVVADRPELDIEVWTAVSEWLRTSWPFRTVRYAAR